MFLPQYETLLMIASDSPAKVVNLIAVDCEKVKVAVQFISFMWSG